MTLPAITGPNIRGIPGFALDRFLHVDEFCRVRDTDGRIFAAGDATDLPVKQVASVRSRPTPLPPELPTWPGRLSTQAVASGDPRDAANRAGPLYLAAHLIAGRGWLAQILDKPPRPVDEETVAATAARSRARELGPYLDDLNAQGCSRRPASSVLEPRDTDRIHRSVAGGALEQADALGCLGSAT